MDGFDHGSSPRGSGEAEPGSEAEAVVRAVLEAFGRGEALAAMGRFHREVTWAVQAGDAGAVPWFGTYRGRQGIVAMLDKMAVVGRLHVEVVETIGQGDRVAVVSRVAMTDGAGLPVEVDEVQVWDVDGGKVRRVRVFTDTLTLARAFGSAAQEIGGA